MERQQSRSSSQHEGDVGGPASTASSRGRAALFRPQTRELINFDYLLESPNLDGKRTSTIGQNAQVSSDDKVLHGMALLLDLDYNRTGAEPSNHTPITSNISSGARTYYTAPTSRTSAMKYLMRNSNSGSGMAVQRQLDVLAMVDEEGSSKEAPPGGDSEFQRLLASKDLIVSPQEELDWSGRGQHVEYTEEEEIPLLSLGNIGTSMTALVDKVRCRRIILARKRMRCTRRWTLNDAIDEVSHLHRLRHAHIVQLVGSYVMRRVFAILIYPAADCHLGQFMEEVEIGQMRYKASLLESLSGSTCTSSSGDFYKVLRAKYDSLAASLSCLAHALQYIHQNTTKHMDIKPANILVKFVPLSIRSPGDPEYRIYIADFGLSHSFATQDHSQSEGPSPFTPKYCAPEVFNFDKRGRSADVFSLGCVYLEIITVLLGMRLDDFALHRSSPDSFDESYHNHLKKVKSWVTLMTKRQWPLLGMMPPNDPAKNSMLYFILHMLNVEPKTRPTADDVGRYFRDWESKGLQHVFRARDCCSRPPEPYIIEPVGVS